MTLGTGGTGAQKWMIEADMAVKRVFMLRQTSSYLNAASGID